MGNFLRGAGEDRTLAYGATARHLATRPLPPHKAGPSSVKPSGKPHTPALRPLLGIIRGRLYCAVATVTFRIHGLPLSSLAGLPPCACIHGDDLRVRCNVIPRFWPSGQRAELPTRGRLGLSRMIEELSKFKPRVNATVTHSIEL